MSCRRHIAARAPPYGLLSSVAAAKWAGVREHGVHNYMQHIHRSMPTSWAFRTEHEDADGARSAPPASSMEQERASQHAERWLCQRWTARTPLRRARGQPATQLSPVLRPPDR